MSDQSTPLADSRPVDESPQPAGTIAPSPSSGTQQPEQSEPPVNPSSQQSIQTTAPAADPSPPEPGLTATQPASVTPDPLLADRQRYWYGFTKATQAVILAVVVVLALLAFFLL